MAGGRILLVSVCNDFISSIVSDTCMGIAHVCITADWNIFMSMYFYIVWLFCVRLVFMIMALYSFYIPQIISNVRSNKKRSLHWSFILGMGVTRLFFPLYVLGCPKNVFILTLEIPVSSYSTKHGINIGLCVLLGVWMGIQVCM